ncbi:MAG: phenylalanine--tRNA ligase subunit beta [Patescibacteria group bacterium]|nr:phenylalanine--tRNA ligase subunit beta [Patescibacteria group bacterium]
MYLSLNWVKDWLKLPKDASPKDLALALTMSTVEVEELIDQSAALENIIVGKVEEIAKHPNADKLQVCQVNIGLSTEQIVCGGTNLSKGILVALALPGAKVKWHGQGDYVQLDRTKIRGIESQGMIAAADEIGLETLFPSFESGEILILSGTKIKPGQSLAEALELNDQIIDIDNKSINHRPDLWGQYGLARELAAIYKLKLAPYKTPEIKSKNELKLKAVVEDKENCFRYQALAIKNISVAESPWWLKNRLAAVGIRPINNIVDVSNYLMYELGQPLHAFDAKEISGHKIIVKQAQKGDKFVSLDGQSRKLPAGALMIADKDKYVALAGIIGGQNSEISDQTKDIILESANFRAVNIRRTSSALGLRTESSSRFEKSLDPLLTQLAIKRAAELILSLCPEAYVASDLLDIDNNPFKAISIEVEEDLINRRCGQIIQTAEIKSILKRLEFDFRYQHKTFYIQVPSWRATKDLSIAEDIVEEIARIYGYNNIDPKLPLVSLEKPMVDIALYTERELVKWLALSQGYHQLMTYPFSDQSWIKKMELDLSDHVKVKNALSPEQTYLNLSLLPNLFKKAQENLRWFDNFKIFELERVFDKKNKGVFHSDASRKKFLPRQDKRLSGLELSQKNQEEVFLSVKGLLEALLEKLNIEYELAEQKLPYGRFAYQINTQELALGQFGILDENLLVKENKAKVNVAFWDLDFALLVKYLSWSKKHKALPKFPAVYRDMAVIVSSQTAWRDLEKEIKKINPLIRQLEPFDVFAGQGIEPGKKSVAFHLEFRSDERTLLAEDIDKIMAEILAILVKKFEAKLR